MIKIHLLLGYHCPQLLVSPKRARLQFGNSVSQILISQLLFKRSFNHFSGSTGTNKFMVYE
jgi:hypothetical protein